MPVDPVLDAEARRWIAWAADDRAAARVMAGVPGSAIFPKQACYLAQQAAEKSLKAYLIATNIDFPKTHDLLRLRDLLPQDAQVRSVPGALSELTDWAVQSRYPGPYVEILPTDSVLAMNLAQAIFTQAQADLQRILGISNSQPHPPSTDTPAAP